MQQSKLTKTLQDLGFTEKEALIYLELLKLNEAPSSAIARQSNIKRSTTYSILEQLKKRGLVSQTKRQGSLFFRALDPYIFLKEQKNKFTNLRKSVDNLKETLPELLNLHSQYITAPHISVFSGKKGIVQIMEDTLTSSTELLCWTNPIVVSKFLGDYCSSYTKRKVKNKIWLRGIFCCDKHNKKLRTEEEDKLREIYVIPKEQFPFKNEINIYDDKVSIISHEDQIGVIVQNQNIADTQRAIFKLGFIAAKKIGIPIR